MKDYENRQGVRSGSGFEALTTLGAQKLPDHQTVPAEMYETLGNATGLAARVLELADRLLGPRPSEGSGTDSVASGPSGDFAKMRYVMRDTREALADAKRALDAIERELVG